jgi:helicase
MRVSNLVKYGIPPLVVESWQKNQGELLLPLQVQALKKYKILKGENLVICAPTSSGKTFCGELAAVVNLFHNKKVVYLVPLKSIAEEKFFDFSQKYSDLGIKVIISTRDRKEFDSDLEKGDFDLAIVIYEKFNQLLIKNLDILCMINLIVVDELQMIGDLCRGHILELSLTKILFSKYNPQILGLSAVLKDAEVLSSWLGSELLFEKSRPVELLQGMLLDGRFIYRKHNSQEEGEEKLVDLTSDQPQEVLFSNLEKLIQDGEQVLVFLKSKIESEICTLIFAERVKLPPAHYAIEALNELEPTTLKEKLIFCLNSGVAFHNADLAFDERRIVEDFYLRGEIRVIFSTTTLAMGVNLPAKTVFIEAQKYIVGEYSDKGILTPISWAEYENMSGRAGRFKLQKDFGRSIILAYDRFHFDALWEEYIEGKEERLLPGLAQENPDDIILDLVASGSAKSISDLDKLISSTLSSKLGFRLKDSIGERIKRLVDLKILLREGENSIFSSELGKTLAVKGISIQTGLDIKKKLDQDKDFDNLSWFYDLLDTEDGKNIYVNISWGEIQNKVYQKKLKEKDQQKTILNQNIRTLLENGMSFTLEQQRKVKLSLLFCDWISPLTTLELERKYNLRSGYINQVAQRMSWLVDSAVGLVRVLNKDQRLFQFLKSLSSMAQFGVNQEGLGLAQLKLSGLGRGFIWKLVKAGLFTLENIKRTEIKDLKKIIPESHAEKLKATLRLKEKDIKIKKKRRDYFKFKKSVIPQLLIDGTPIKDKFLIFLSGKRVSLSGKSFSYLFKLAWAVFKKDGGWLHKLDLEEGDNQAKYIYRLRKELNAISEESKALILNNRLGSYRLNIPKDKIEFNLRNLRLYADAEIKGILDSGEKTVEGAVQNIVK